MHWYTQQYCSKSTIIFPKVRVFLGFTALLSCVKIKLKTTIFLRVRVKILHLSWLVIVIDRVRVFFKFDNFAVLGKN